MPALAALGLKGLAGAFVVVGGHLRLVGWVVFFWGGGLGVWAFASDFVIGWGVEVWRQRGLCMYVSINQSYKHEQTYLSMRVDDQGAVGPVMRGEEGEKGHQAVKHRAGGLR